jgi:predicted DNA-binding protein (UPF0251 family)
VARLPNATVYKPAGVPARDLEWLTLTFDQLEALRLVDLDGLSHQQAAERLGVSRQTVGRMLELARRTIADALTTGKALQLAGGAYRLTCQGPEHLPRCCERRGEDQERTSQ